MSPEKRVNKQQGSPGDKLDALKLALQQRDKPSGKFMKAFETLMRKDKEDN